MQSGHWALPAGLGHQKARPGLDGPKSPRAARGPAGLLRPLDFRKCALYDFQYCGKGLGAVDVVCFLATSVDGGIMHDDERDALRTRDLLPSLSTT
jgi:hypothetical protein